MNFDPSAVQLPDFLNLPVVALFTYLVMIAITDVLFNVLAALAAHKFDPTKLLDFLVSHVVLRVFIIGVLGIFGHGIPVAQVPAIPAVSALASAALGGYIVETLWSLWTALPKQQNPPAAQ